MKNLLQFRIQNNSNNFSPFLLDYVSLPLQFTRNSERLLKNKIERLARKNRVLEIV